MMEEPALRRPFFPCVRWRKGTARHLGQVPVNLLRGLTKSRQGTNFLLFRGHLSRPACSHVKQLAKQAGTD